MNIPSLLYLIFVSFFGVMTSFLLPITIGRLRLLIGPALGIIITTELVLIVNLITGFSDNSIIAALLLYGVILMVLYLRSSVILNLTTHQRDPASWHGFQDLSSIFNRVTFKQVMLDFISLIQNHWPLILILFSIGSVVFYVFWTKILSPTPYGLVTGGEGLYGDTALHSAYTMAIVEQGLPPTNPLFARIPLIYPFLVNLFSATLIKLGTNLRFAFILPQLMYFLGFTTLFYWVVKGLHLISWRVTRVRDPNPESHVVVPPEVAGTMREGWDTRAAGPALNQANLTAFFAMLIFFLGWGLGFTQYFDTAIKTGDWSITREYTNNLPGFNMHNVLVGLVFPERSFLPGLFIGMLITALVLEQMSNSTNKSRKEGSDSARQSKIFPQFIIRHSSFIIIGILLGILPLWHMHTFLFFGVAIGVWWVILSFRRNEVTEKSRRNSAVRSRFAGFRASLEMTLKQLFTIYGPALLLSLPVFFWLRQQISHDSFIHFASGWLDSKTNPVFFWLKNTGLLIPLAIFGAFKLSSRTRPFFLPAVLVFIIANFVVFQPWDWDNIKLFSWVFLFISIAAGYTLVGLLSPRMVAGKSGFAGRAMTPPRWTETVMYFTKTVFVLLIFLSLTLSGTLSLTHIVSGEFTIYDNADIELAAWVKDNTKPTDTFLVDPWPNHPIPGLSGRSVYLGYPGHLWVHGISYGEREEEVKKILAGDLSLLENLEIPLKYIVADKNSASSLLKTQLPVVFDNQKFVVFTW